MLRSCEAGPSTAPRPMRWSSARRRAATAAVSTGRPIPGSSATTLYAPIGAADLPWGEAADAANRRTLVSAVVRMALNLHALDAACVPERNYGTHDDQFDSDTRGSGTACRAHRGART